MKTKYTKNKTEIFKLRLSKETRQQLEELSENNNVGLSAMVRKLIADAYQEVTQLY